MAEAEVLHNIKFTRARGTTDEATPSMDDPIYSNISYSETQRPASNRRSGVTSERVALLVLSVLLAAAVTALGVTLHENTQTKKLQEECEAKHLSEILSKTQAYKVGQPCQPPSVREQTCPSCEDGWEPHGGKCYFFSSVKLTWIESRRQCKSMRGDLVVINSREEQRILESRVMEKMDKAEFWIGLTDSEEESEWLWVDNTRLDRSLTFWREGEPNNWNVTNPDGEDCVTMWEKDGATDLKIWFDQPCKSPHEYICEKPQKA
ncbi:C-type lectin domain family 4 member E-like [Platichthys flesus]|uniref:C-type lectin domain family 4 member E-like n=1 Tax=Platichthys flesus TaxID=8260 RepID=UPI002DB84845|nr:C-type lectin domain family 4 member E-like [Platichthys flesus]XP_062266197.1 C-type lectin domain family 4 member E-like [Platichthys flesus]